MSTEKRKGTPPAPTFAPNPGSGETRTRTFTGDDPSVIVGVVIERLSLGSRIVRENVAEPPPNVWSVTVNEYVPAIAPAPTFSRKVVLAVPRRGIFGYVGAAGTVVTPAGSPETASVPVPAGRIGSPDSVTATVTLCVG